MSERLKSLFPSNPDPRLIDLDVYLVGGAVRDALLGLPVHERDYVVVGAHPETMGKRGFHPVGRDFPVFVHPDTGEEYALARLEKKTGHGYHGFQFYADPEVTLAQDLVRRDLTINAMALDRHGQLFDPCHGQPDLRQRILRHISPAFAEDPVRVLRVARFFARFQPLGFGVAPETEAIMRQMVDQGETRHLQPERIWKECARALEASAPEGFFAVLRNTGALAHLFPEGNGQIPMGTVYPQLPQDVAIRWAYTMDALGYPSPAVARQACDRLGCPHRERDLACLWLQWRDSLRQGPGLSPEQTMAVLTGTDAWRRPERFGQLCAVLADPLLHAYWNRSLEVTQQIPIQPLIQAGHQGAELGQALAQARQAALQTLWSG